MEDIGNEIENHLYEDSRLIENIESLVIKISLEHIDKKNLLLAGFAKNLLTHYISMNILMNNGLYNSAFALERIFFEDVVRLKYMYFIMDRSQICAIYSSKNWNTHFPTVPNMVNEISRKYDNEFYKLIKKNVYKMMNDYTHTGKNQIARNFNDLNSSRRNDFEDNLILDTLKSNRKLLITSILVFLEFGFISEFISREEIDSLVEEFD